MRSGIAWLIAIRLASGDAIGQYARRSDYAIAQDAAARVQQFDVDVDMSGGMTVKVKKAQHLALDVNEACPPELHDLDADGCDNEWLTPTCDKIDCKQNPASMFKQLCDMCLTKENANAAMIKGKACMEVYESLCRDFYDSDSDTSGQSSTWSATSSGSSSATSDDDEEEDDDDYLVESEEEEEEDEDDDEPAPILKKKKNKKTQTSKTDPTMDIKPKELEEATLEPGHETGCPWCCGGNPCGKLGPMAWDGHGLRACLSAAVLAYLSVA
jgi:hypothetical protein